MKTLEDVSGRRFGRWQVLRYTTPTADGSSRVMCKCDCGTVRRVLVTRLVNRKTKSCGCRIREIHNRIVGTCFWGTAERRAKFEEAKRA